MNNEDLLEIERTTYRESMRDGLTEFLLGLVLIVVPGLMLESFFVPIFVVFYILFLPQGFEAFRRRFTYSRTGYVKLREDQPPKLSLGVAVVVLLIFISIIAVFYSLAIGVIDRYFIWRCLPAVFGFIMWGPSLYLKDKTGQNRYYLLGTLMTVTGLAVTLAMFIPATYALTIYMLSWGLAFVVLGIIRFTLFVRKYPIVDIPEDGSSEQ